MSVALPPLNFNGGKSQSDATGGTASGAFDNSGFTVNYAPSIGVGGGSMPSWVWIVAAVAGVVWMVKR